MENNIFFKNKKDKFNPDVISNLSKKSSEMRKNIFQESTVVYNGITNTVPDRVKNSKDLKMDRDLPLDNPKRLMKQKLEERNRQEYDLKPQKVKALPQSYIVDKHIENFDELKQNSEQHLKETMKQQDIQKNKYKDIMSSLKGLGIIN